MISKKFMFLAIFIVGLLAVSAVSAADNSTGDIVNVEETDGVLSVDGNQLFLRENNDVGNFDELAKEINAITEGGVLNLTKNYKYIDGSDEGIEINKAITIDGKGHTLDGNQLSRIFEVSAKEVTLKNMIFINGHAENGGGGAIRWSGDNGVLSGCSFINCSSWQDGGAVYWKGDNSSLFDCSFVNCYADDGGAVRWLTHNGHLFDCSFINCSSGWDGGAVYWSGADGVLSDCSFVNCSSVENGGAITFYSNDACLSNCSFVNCSAVGLDEFDGYGGAVYLKGADGVLANCSFVDCSAAVYGGAVCWSDADGVLANCSFVDCSADDGGGVCWFGDYGFLDDCSFVNCRGSHGGGIYFGGKNCSLMRPYFEGNYYDDWYSIKPIHILNETIATVLTASDVVTSYKSYENIVATLKDVNGNAVTGAEVKITFDGVNETLTTDDNGQISLPLNNVKPGNYTAVITFDGDLIYEKSNATVNVVVTKADTIISAPDVNIAYRDPNDELVATIVNEHGKPLVVTLYVKLNGNTFTAKTDSNGQVKIPISTLTPGKYSARISYKGSSNYNAASTTARVTVTKAATIIRAPDISLAYKDPNGELVANIINEHGKPLVVNLNVKFNGKDYTVRTDSNGQARIAVGTLTPGTYTATISYKGSSNYEASSTTTKVTVTKASTVISAPNVSIAYKNPSGELVATIVNEHGKPLVVNLKVNINGKDYTVRTDSNGQARIAVGTLTPGTYTATISYKGSSNYEASNTTARVKVTRAATIITAPDVSVAYNDSNGKLVSTITNEHGKPLVVNLNVDLNGKTYSVRTDSNGQASVSTADLAPGTYTAAISYKGSSNYKSSSTTAIIEVKN